MSDISKSLRIGDLLVEKRLISVTQLRQAIEIQQYRAHEKSHVDGFAKKYELGEILIELGFISRHQLKANLSWQRRLKATTAMMVFVAPLLTAACGGGGGGGGANTAQPAANSASQALPTNVEKPTTSSSESKSSVASSAISQSSSSVASPKSAVFIDGSAQLLWTIPTNRANGEYLDITEIGGYEIRYKLSEDQNYTVITVKDGFTDAYYFNYLKGDYQFEIATFDKDGLYSDFIPINPS